MTHKCIHTIHTNEESIPACSFRRTVPHIKGQSSLVAVGMTARITIDSSWTASQMHSRLALLFRGLFIKDAGRRFSFTYLQVCVCAVYTYTVHVSFLFFFNPERAIVMSTCDCYERVFQCVQGSRVLFVPDTPAGGWTGKQVLRISEHSALYILSHHDYLQVNFSCSVFPVERERTKMIQPFNPQF